MLELTDELKDYLKASINRGFLSFTADNGDEYHVPMTQERRELCLQAIASGWWDVEALMTL